jgi:hypothetical protein
MTDLATFSPERAPSHYPARSKMLDMYTGDIARMLAEGQLESAERAALAIPHIAVALTDAGLQSSSLLYQDWCVRWVQPDFGLVAYSEWCSRNNGCEGSSGLPFAALRALRLQRRARELHTPSLRPAAPGEARAGQAVTCALLEAVSRWYEQDARNHPLVQTNLARLGVLR